MKKLKTIKQVISVKPFRLGKSGAGFTLIELIIAISVIAIISTFGLASFVSYSRAQTLNAAVLDLSTLLNKAKSRAQSQSIQDASGNNSRCGNYSFVGYKVVLCGIPEVPCLSSSDYELDIVCSNNTTSLIESKKFPNDKITFDSVNTTSTSFLFRAFVGGVSFSAGASGSRKVRVNGYSGAYKEITVDPTGNISVNN